MAAPNLEAANTDFIIEQPKETVGEGNAAEQTPNPKKAKAAKETPKPEAVEEENSDEFDLSDITHNPAEQSREEIIAAAEAAAFAQG